MMVMLPSLKRITNVQSPLQRGLSSAERLFAMLDEPDEADTGTHPLQRAQGELEFRDVSLRYDGQPEPALTAVSFTARRGTVTAIVGRSGSGKSSLVRLLPRFYEPSRRPGTARRPCRSTTTGWPTCAGRSPWSASA